MERMIFSARAPVQIWRGAAIAALLLNVGCGPGASARNDYGGDPQSGAVAIVRAGCGSCHIIPGIPNADGLVGPPLIEFGRRTTVAGLLPNTPDSLVYWLRHPQWVVPGNAMPDTGLTETQAHDVAAYLYTLR